MRRKTYSPLNSLVKLGIIKDQQSRLATSLKSDVLDVDSCALHDLLSGNSAASEGNLVDIQMAGNSLTTLSSVAVQDIDNSRWETSLGDQRRQVKDGKRSLLSSLNNNRVSARQRRAQLPRSHIKRVVPWDNLSTNTDWLLDGICKLGRTNIDDLAVDLVGVAGVVLEDCDDIGKILVKGDLVWLSVVPGLDCSQGLGILLNQLGKLEHQVTTVGWCDVPP